jgi:predicted transcriptional regulator
LTETEIRRNNWQVLKDILVAAQAGALKTHLVYRANSNFRELKDYLAWAIAKELLREEGDRYWTTTKGEQFVAGVLSLELMISG